MISERAIFAELVRRQDKALAQHLRFWRTGPYKYDSCYQVVLDVSLSVMSDHDLSDAKLESIVRRGIDEGWLAEIVQDGADLTQLRMGIV